MNKKELVIGGIAFLVIQFLLNTGIFVRFIDMQAYAVSKDSFSLLCNQIQTIRTDVKDIKNYLLEKD